MAARVEIIRIKEYTNPEAGKTLSAASFHRLVEILRHTPSKAILLDARWDGKRDTPDGQIYLLISKIPLEIKIKKIAVLEPKSIDMSKVDFIEDVAANNGVHLKVFTDEQQAMEWLGSM